MPTINQLTKKPRSKKVRKSKSPVLLVGKNSIQKKQTVQVSPQKEEYVQELVLQHLRNQTQH